MEASNEIMAEEGEEVGAEVGEAWKVGKFVASIMDNEVIDGLGKMQVTKVKNKEESDVVSKWEALTRVRDGKISLLEAVEAKNIAKVDTTSIFVAIADRDDQLWTNEEVILAIITSEGAVAEKAMDLVVLGVEASMVMVVATEGVIMVLVILALVAVFVAVATAVDWTST